MCRVSMVTGERGGVGFAEVAASSRGLGEVAPIGVTLVGDVTTCCFELGTQSYT